MPPSSAKLKASARFSDPPDPEIQVEYGAVQNLANFFDSKGTIGRASMEDRIRSSRQSSLAQQPPEPTSAPPRPPPAIPSSSHRPGYLSPSLPDPDQQFLRRQSQNDVHTTPGPFGEDAQMRRSSTSEAGRLKWEAVSAQPDLGFRPPRIMPPQDHIAAVGRIARAALSTVDSDEPACYHCSGLTKSSPEEVDKTPLVNLKVQDEQGNTESLGVHAGRSAIADAFKKSGNFFKQRSQNANDVLVELKDEVLDFTMMATASITGKGLCTACSKIPFGQFHPDARLAVPETTRSGTYVKPMHKMLSQRDSCKFCGLLFQALCRPENDSLKAQPVRDYIQKKFEEKSFRQWADMQDEFKQRVLPIDSRWPFGASRDSSKSDPQLRAAQSFWDDPERRDSTIAAAGIAANATLVDAATAEKDPKRALALAQLGGIASSTALLATLQKQRLPCWIFIELKNKGDKDAGLIIIDVHGHGRRERAPISRISHFHVRLESDIARQTESSTLRYANRLKDPDLIDLSVMRRCLSHCKSTHGMDCKAPLLSNAAPRVFRQDMQETGHLESQTDSHKPWQEQDDRIVLIDLVKEQLCEERRSDSEYACLSYKWGGLQALTLQRSNRAALMSDGGLKEGHAHIPNTIADAMEITKALHINYLWVDALCVIQDEREPDNKHHIGQMDRIYGDACITIVAADSETANSGIRGVTKKNKRAAEQIAEELTSEIIALVPFGHELDLMPWNGRAWTLQERYVSKRLLIFSGGHVRFFCRKGSMHEDVPAIDAGFTEAAMNWTLNLKPKTSPINDYVVRKNDTFSLLRSSLFSEYASLIHEYTHRSMKKEVDALRAVSGLLSLLERIRDVDDAGPSRPRTFFGLPEEFLDLALLWHPPAHEGARLLRRPLCIKDMPPGELPPPSWSWAAWKVCESESSPVTGVRYEEPFLMNAYPDGTLRKVKPPSGEQSEERVSPMLRWYRWGQKAPPPDPQRKQHKSAASNGHSITMALNGNGSGLLLRGSSRATSNEHTSLVLDLTVLKQCIPDDRHLIFASTVAKFRLGHTSFEPRKETLWRLELNKQFVPDQEMNLYETQIMDRINPYRAVGRLTLPDRENKPYGVFDFIAISEAQCFGDEKLSEISGYSLYNVMMVKWQENGVVAERIALGKIYKHAWEAAQPKVRTIVLA